MTEENGCDLEKWLAGFVDGDATIRANVRKDPTCKIGYYIMAEVTINQAYVAGLLDSDGYIGAHRYELDSTIGHSIQPRVKISQSKKNATIIPALAHFCEIYDVGCSVHHIETDGANSQNQYAWRVSGVENVEKLLGVLKEYMIVKYRQADIMLEKIIPVLNEADFWTKERFIRVMYYKDKMDELKGGERGKYTLEYFEDLWGIDAEELMQTRLSDYSGEQVVVSKPKSRATTYHCTNDCHLIKGDCASISNEEANLLDLNKCDLCHNGNNTNKGESVSQLHKKLQNGDVDLDLK